MPAVSLLFPIVALILATALILGMRYLRRGLGYFWLAAVAGALVAWGLVLATGSDLPLNLPLANWQPRILMPISPALLLDRVSWPIQLCLAALTLAVILTNVIRPTSGGRPGGSWYDLAGILIFSAVAMLANLAGNMLALLLAWSLLDLTETILWLEKLRSSRESNRVVISLAVRLVGVGLATWGMIVSNSEGQSLALSFVSPQLAPYLLVAAGIRLGVLPLHPPLPQVGNTPAGLRSLLCLAPAASSLVILVRAASSPLPAASINLLLALAGLAALLGGLVWLNTTSVLEGLPYWIGGVGGLALAAGLRGQPGAALSWGLALLAYGGLLGLATVRPRSIRILLFLTALGFSALPFTPTWPGMRLYAPPLHPLLPVFLVSQVLFTAGILKQALRSIPAPAQAERWVWIIYPFGLLLLFATAILVSWWPAPGTLGSSVRWPSWLESVFAGIAIFLAGMGIVVFRRRHASKRRQHLPLWLERLRAGLEFSWLYRLAWEIFHWMMHIASFTSRALEGQAGVLWALLFLALLLSLFVQLTLRGG
jgi:hypothetical protein